MCLRVTVSEIDSSAGSENVRESERALYERERKIVQCQLVGDRESERVLCVSQNLCCKPEPKKVAVQKLFSDDVIIEFGFMFLFSLNFKCLT